VRGRLADFWLAAGVTTRPRCPNSTTGCPDSGSA